MNLQTQTKLEDSITYDPAVALAFFQRFGESVSVKQGKKIFSPQKTNLLSIFQSDKIYLLEDGELTVKSTENFDHLEPSEIFGEFTPISKKYSTVIAATPCKLITLTENQLLEGLRCQPEFILMLMGLFVKYLRDSHFNVKNQQQERITLLSPKEMEGALPAEMVETLVELVGSNLILEIPKKRVVLREGGSAMLMYIIIKGYLVTFVGKKAIWRSGAGDVVGEIALIDQDHRTASVMAETHCSLLAIDHQTLFDLVEKLPTR
ncbi:MAG: cyclic nucleotide-binding domain-containing protein [Methylococcaceae bacterium]|nr:cyclic nucleotide-binding domain-containing protein [Methylococcaceae bacterium]